MKFRKVCRDNPATGVSDGTWMKARTGKGGCSIQTVQATTQEEVNEDVNKLPVEKKDILSTTENNVDNEAVNETANQMEETVVTPSEQDTTVAAPTPKNIQYTPSEDLVLGTDAVKQFLDLAREKKVDENEVPLDQLVLDKAEILSFENVLLPAIGFEENQALKQMQRKVQRDTPDQTNIVVRARSVVGRCILKGERAAQESRLRRRALDEQREQNWAGEREAKREENRKARAQEAESRQAEMEKRQAQLTLKEKREAQKNFLPNQELWREVAYLMTESSKLERECQLWEQVETLLDAGEKDVHEKEEKYNQTKQLEAEDTASPMIVEEDETLALPMETLQKSAEEIMSSSNDIQAALKLVTDLMLESAKLRKDLYRRYRQDHQFEGYRGVNDPKGLIRILSQDDA